MITVQDHNTYRLAAVVSAVVNRVGVFSFLITYLLLCACSNESDSQQDTKTPVAVDFALTVSKSTFAGASGTTRMQSDNMNANAATIDLHCVIPFDKNREIRLLDQYYSSPIESGFTHAHSTQPFYTSTCSFSTGVYSVLAYGNDLNRSEGPAKGALTEDLGDYEPVNIRFHLKSIQTKDDYLGTEEKITIPEAMANYLTTIATVSIGEGDDKITWKDGVTNATLKLLYKNFINQMSGEVGNVLPGSSANIKEWVKQLKNQLPADDGLNDDDKAIKELIKDRIEDELDPSTNDWKETAWKDFPASLGLPDGAAVVRWDGEEFVPETQTTTVADINNLERFTYPAEIYYYGNSLVMVNNNQTDFSSKDKWKDANDPDDVLYGFEEGMVQSSTKTVAMKDPLQFGIAQLQVKVKSSTATLLDADEPEAEVTVGSESFPLTGIIVGGQLPVGFDFRPESAQPAYSEAEMRFIYDNQFDNNIYLSTSESSAVNTFVLQSYEGRNVKIVLEFVNNSDTDFRGFNGIVYRGTKFYLVGEMDPSNGKPTDTNLPAEEQEDLGKRVFTQDRITLVTAKVIDLKKAYNVLPNLMSPRLEMGIELTPQWEQATTTDVIL